MVLSKWLLIHDHFINHDCPLRSKPLLNLLRQRLPDRVSQAKASEAALRVSYARDQGSQGAPRGAEGGGKGSEDKSRCYFTAPSVHRASAALCCLSACCRIHLSLPTHGWAATSVAATLLTGFTLQACTNFGRKEAACDSVSLDRTPAGTVSHRSTCSGVVSVYGRLLCL